MSLDKLNEILESQNIPTSVKETVKKLNLLGKEALNSYYDKSSFFYKNAQPGNLAHNFFASPKEYPDLYHYTQSKSLESILKSKNFLIGSIDEMNDTEEMKHTLDMCCKCLSSLKATSDEKNKFRIEFIATMIRFDAYVWSFNPNGNSMAMERYGDVALGFSNQEVQERLTERFTPMNLFEGYLKQGDAFVFPLRVNYDQEYQLDYLFPIVKVALACIQNMKVDPFDMKQVLKDSMAALYLLALCFKRYEIREENEVRFLILRVVTDGITQEDLLFNNRRMVKIGIDDKFLRSIIINHDWDGKEKIFSDMVRKHGFINTKIKKTAIPY